MTNGSYMMNNALCSNLVVVTCLALLAIAPDEKAPNPKSRARSHEQPRDMFTNVFVQRRAHNEFAKAQGSGQRSAWSSSTNGVPASRSSINEKGRYRTDLMELPVEGKDWARNPDE